MLSYNIAPSIIEKSNSKSISSIIDILLGFVAFPLAIIMVYFFYNFFIGFIKKNITKKIKYSYFIICSILLIIFMFSAKLKIEQGDSRLLNQFKTFSNLFFIIIIYILLIWILFKTKNQFSTKIKKKIKILVWIYIGNYTLNIIMILPFISTIIGFFHVPLLFLYINIFPLLILKNILENNEYTYGPNLTGNLRFNQILKEKKISIREKEIIMLIIDGKNNKEIEEILYISFNTVRNHIYKIFKKFKINSRSQLISFFIKYKELK